ncbi:MAG TPA: ABC transporter permease [Candidatus Angelobacter sp.]|nr:ABC transporter permease [Candidatus Angelobacter sp.]
MPDWKEIVRERLAALRLEPSREAALIEELSQHLRDTYAELLAQGVADEEAARETLLELNDIRLLAEELRNAKSPLPSGDPRLYGTTNATWSSALFGLWQDFRFGLRGLRKDARVASLATFTLAIGIGASTLIFSILENVQLSPFPYKDANRLARVYEHFSSGLINRDAFAPEEFVDFRQQNHSFADLLAVGSLEILYSGPEGTRQTWGAWISPEIFAVLGIRPLRGRAFELSDGEPGAPPVCAISYRLWTEQFGQDPSILGRPLTLNGERRTLVSILPPRSRFLDLDIWMPIHVRRDTAVLGAANVRAYFGAVGHLKRGATLKSAAADLEPILARYEKDHPANYPEQIDILLKSFTDSQVGDSKGMLFSLMGAVIVLLLIACSNVANLLMARATAREREMAIRSALGAERWRLVRQLLVESFVLACAGCAAGCAFAELGLKATLRFIPADALPSEIQIGLNPTVIFFSVLLAFITTLLCGLAPALRAATANLLSALATSSKGGTSGFAHGRFRAGLVISEVALSIVLLTASGLMLRSFFALQHVELGFEPSHLLWLRVALPQGRYDSAEQKKVFFEAALSRVTAIPGVTMAAESYAPPSCCAGPSVLNISGKEHAGTWYVRYEPISTDYFRTLQTPLLRGRLLTQSEVLSAGRVTVVNQAMVRTYFAGAEPIGRKIEFGSFDNVPDYPHNAWFEIVGVVADAKNRELTAPAEPEAYIPYTTFGRTSRSLLVRTAVDPVSLLPEIRRALWAVEPDAALSRAVPVEDFLKDYAYSEPVFALITLSFFAGIGLLLVVVGVFSVMAYSVTLQSHEIGVRMALGAQRGSVLRMVLAKGFRLIVSGIAAGVAISFVLTRLAASQFWGVSPRDPWTFSLVTALLLIVGLAACWFPARRATQVDPLVAIRHE